MRYMDSVGCRVGGDQLSCIRLSREERAVDLQTASPQPDTRRYSSKIFQTLDLRQKTASDGHPTLSDAIVQGSPNDGKDVECSGWRSM